MTAGSQPTPMTLADIAPELRESIGRMPNLSVTSALERWFVRQAMRLVFRNRQIDGVSIEKAVTRQGVNLRMYTPQRALTGAALLWIHGGGMVVGRAAQDDLFCAETARELGLVIISTEYRLAPEYPFPAALDDCTSAWAWLQDSAANLGIDQMRIAVGGESAGGGLAASLAQRLRDMGGVQPAAQWLICPMLDDRTATRHELDALRHKIFDNRQNRYCWRAYLAAEPGADPLPEYAVPARRQDVRGLPPAWIGVGDIELFYEEDKTYADRLTAAGVDCTFDVVVGAPHGFETIARNTALAQAYLSRARDWLRSALDSRTHT